LLQPFPIETADYLTVYDSDRRGHNPSLHQFIQGCRIVDDAPYLEGDTLLRKKLFCLLAEVSTAGLRIDYNALGHAFAHHVDVHFVGNSTVEHLPTFMLRAYPGQNSGPAPRLAPSIIPQMRPPVGRQSTRSPASSRSLTISARNF
jgi:hypothetical protein